MIVNINSTATIFTMFNPSIEIIFPSKKDNKANIVNIILVAITDILYILYLFLYFSNTLFILILEKVLYIKIPKLELITRAIILLFLVI